MKVKAKLVLGAALLSAVTSLMVWTFAFQAGVTTIQKRTANLVDFLGRCVQDETAHLTNAMADQARRWSQDQILIATTAANKNAQLTKRLNALSAGNLSCRSLVVLSPSSKLLAPSGTKHCNSNNNTWLKKLKVNNSVKKALEGRLVAGASLYPLPDTISNPSALWQIATPITHKNNTVGALLASYSWDSQLTSRLVQLLSNLERTSLNQAQIHFLDNKGTIISSTHAELIGQLFVTPQGWLSFNPATTLEPKQGQLVLTTPQEPLNQAIASLKAKTFTWALAGGLALLLGLYVLGHLLLSRRLHKLLDLSRSLLRTIDDSQTAPKVAPHGDEIQQLTRTLDRANTELANRQQNMQNVLAELTSLNENLTQADRLKDEFVANMSHEIRTPMNGILGFAELLSQEDLTTGQHEYVNTILKCGTNLLTLINDVLDLARIDAGHLQIHHQLCSVGQIAEQTCELVQNQAQQKGIKLIWQIAQDVPDQILLDPERLGQILLNITSNAVKFTNRGFVNLNVSTTWREDRQGLRISIADSGIGIAPEKRDLVFEPFAQVDGSDHRPYGGAGLGLAICRKLVDALKGTIKLHSIPGKGSEFVVWLPFEHSEQSSGQADLDATVQGALANDSTRNSDIPPRVLVVEDDRICGEFFKTYLSRNGYVVLIETDGGKAVERVKQTKPDAVILDLRLPGRSGLDILSELKSKPSTEGIPVIVCSVLQCEDRALNLGALEYLHKPFTGHELLRVVRRAVVERKTTEILAVDDEPTVRRLYDVALKRAGLKVITASNGREAMELLAVHPQIGLVLLDLVMPGMSGFEVLARIRNSGKTNLPVIVVTARSMSAEEKQRLNGQANAILHKASLSPQQLLEQIRTQLTKAADSGLWAEQPSPQRSEQHTLPLRQSDSTQALAGTSTTNTGAILIAEDVVYNRRFLEVILERAGYRIFSCSDGAKAVDLASKNRFALIILDIQMPRIDGLEAAKLIREIPHHGSTPIIALTAQTLKGDIQRCLQAGCTDYLHKPTSEGKLLEKVGKYLLPPASAKKDASADPQMIEESLKTAQIQSQLAQDNELMKVVAGYIEDLPRMVTKMIEAVQDQDFETLAGLAHNLKGSSGLAGYPDLVSQTTKIQEAALHKRTEDFTGILKEVVKLCRMVGANMNDVSIDGLFERDSSAPVDLHKQLLR